jgi:hypothetical protein
MDYYGVPQGMIANGNIPCAGFVAFDPSNDDYALPASAGGVCIGVSYPGTNVPPVPGTNAYSATAGQPVTVYMTGAVVEILVGSSNVTRGYVKPDSNGLATNAFPGDIAGAIIYENASAGEFVTGQVLPPGFVVPGATGAGSIVTTATGLTATPAQSGTTFVVTATGQTITLPLGTVGMKFRVIAGAGAAGGAVTVAMNPADSLHGNGFTPAAGKGAVDSTAADGDWIEVQCIATNNWTIISIKGTWTRVP